MAAGYCYCLGINSNAFFLNDYKKAFILGLNVPKVTAYIGFLIVGYFSHSELNVLKKTVHHDEIPEGYNEERDGLSNTPYYFEVPIGENLDHKLTCFTELSYSKLESTLKSVFK